MAGRAFRGLPRVFQRTLGETVTYTPVGGSAVSLRGIFTRDYYAALENGEVGVMSARPACAFPQADVPDAARGDEIVAQGETYEVVEIQPDGMGMVVLILHEQITGARE